MKTKLNEKELKEVEGGEGITLSSVMAVLAIGIVAVIIYRFFVSKKGSLVLPGGYTFNWGK